jgi:hypothetical protein
MAAPDATHRPSPHVAPDATDPAAVATFIGRWSGAALSERANYVSFLKELCSLLDLPHPDPAVADNIKNAYVFERAVPLHDDHSGQTTTGFIDLYKRGCFILEAKQYDSAPAADSPAFAAAEAAQKKSGVRRDTAAWDRKMLEARAQAERYLRHLPADEPAPVFLLVVDVGHSIELFADFSQKGRAPLHFPDPRSYRLRLADLARPEVRQLLRTIWLDPASLDPAKRSAAVTREVATHLAELARLFEKKHPPAAVASFLSRCLFAMFAEDVGLLPPGSFTGLLDSVKDDPGAAVPLLQGLFAEMNTGGYSLVLRKHLLHFNGGLFAEAGVLPLDAAQLSLLRRAAACEWRHVEPAIFGTLLERALDPAERHKLGAHYTPRAYVERLVLPTVLEPLREEWGHARAAAVTLATRGDLKGAIKEARAYHHRLCALRVLDPACGSGNFLYVTLEHLKRLEGEVLELIESFGENMRLDLAGETVDPHQFLGIELNTRAATVAELVLWIGYLQWHHRNRGATEWPEPVLRAFKNIECRDAVLAFDAKGFLTESGEFCPADKIDAAKLRYVWDRRTTKKDPVTGREVPDENAVRPIDAYQNPRPAPWPQADYIVGNPPFLGGWTMRQNLGEGYVEALWKAYPEVPEKADFVMFWWHKAALAVREGKSTRFGFITTNSITQTFQRRILETHLRSDASFRIVFAVPDHPWVDAADGAAVRIAMTVGGKSSEPPCLSLVATENGEDVTLQNTVGQTINADLSVGADVSRCLALQANDHLSSPGVQLYGDGFIVEADEAKHLRELAKSEKARRVIRTYINGRDFMQTPRGVSVIDFFGLAMEDARELHPHAFERVLKLVKPERDQNRRESIKKLWWRYGWERPALRTMLSGLTRYIATTETSKHRIFSFLDGDILPDNRLTAFATDDAFILGVLSSGIHVRYSLAAGGTLEDRPIYTKTACFDPFPFPDCPEAQKARIRALAEALDAHRKRAQADHALGLTDIYNVLERVRALGTPSSSSASVTPLTPKEKVIHDQALVSTLKQLHDELDAAVAAAYGWPWPLTDAEILTRVVALNAQRAAEEASGHIRYLRPEYQAKSAAPAAQSKLALPDEAPAQDTKPKTRVTKAKQPWPKTLAERTKALDALLATETKPLTTAEITKRFARAKEEDIQEILETLAALGRLRRTDEDTRWMR